MSEFKLEIDPRLTSRSQPSFVNAPPPSFAANPVRLPPLQQPDAYGTVTQLSSEASRPPYHSSTSTPSGSSTRNVDHGRVGEHLSHADGSGDPTNDPKRPRACEACRGLKVRCEPDLNKPEGPCKRCAKAGRQCVVTIPSRKRQKKTDSRVAELEKKIDALTASLHATRSGRADSESDESEDESGRAPGDEDAKIEQESNTTLLPDSDPPTKDWLRQTHRTSETMSTPGRKGASPALPSPVVTGQKRRRSEETHTKVVGASSPASKPNLTGSSAKDNSIQWKDDGPNLYPFLMPKGPKGVTTACMYPTSTASQPNNNGQNHGYADVIDRRLIDAETAALIFDRYVNSMAPHMPAVVFPPGTTAAEVRKTKPALFLAIISAGSGIAHLDVQRALVKETMRIYGDRIICNGEKSLELIQALHVSTMWYWPPDNFEELNYYQMVHIAAVMAIEVGLGKRVKPMRPRHLVGLWRDTPWRRERMPGHGSVECKRTWLSCYFLCAKYAFSTLTTLLAG